MYPHRLKAEAFDNAVDVVELLLVPTDQVPNVRHLRVLHTFSSMTSLTLLIHQDVEEVDEFRQQNNIVLVVIPSISPLLLAGSIRRRRHRAERVQNSEVSYVRYLIGRNEKKFDYINRVVNPFRFRFMRVRRHTLPSRCYASPR